MKSVKKLMAAAGLVSVLFLSACISNNESSGSGGEEKLTIGTEATFAPFESMEGDKIVGFDADLLDAVMKEAGLDYEYENTGWDPMLVGVDDETLQAGMAGITITDERKETYDFSAPYFEATQVIAVPEGTDIQSAEDLQGMRIGVQNGTTGDEAAQKLVGENSSDLSKYDSSAATMMALQNGDVEAVVTDIAVAQHYVKNNPDANLTLVEDDENFEQEYYGMLLPKDSEYKEQIDEAIQTIMENGTYEEIYQEWFEGTPDIKALESAQP
ncbi:basic amino acid ABC transporter substrate-binding protein [Terribacillus saccharophilus]|uniref:Basic amino acid ABC transporter substrate-binding protein n=1 Tax=Terribacillus saccharophilus TaxID=361277 RepID=A0A268HF13_9BACI|nr:basic amino acid ABC transporter substrate-binding protein [Terribacillus saccharophilus]PAE08453.1 basic amino acid ABC transporter substrate-binding protein [Terribacillus saccharophilus]